MEQAVTERPVRFVILHGTRTGSNFLCTVLNSHPDILCHHEIFNPFVIGVARHLQGSDFHLGTMEEREKDPAEFLDRVWRVPLGRRAVGFKLCIWQHEAAYRAVLPDASVRKIVLKRRNRIRAFVSLQAARQTREWVVYDDRGAPAARPKVHVDPWELLQNNDLHQSFYEQTEAALRRSGQDYLELWYEDLLAPEGLRPVLDRLGIEGYPLQPEGQTWKLAPPSLREAISNFDALREQLKGSGLEAELDDAPPMERRA
jgi:LPS sulfotransferase NodH